jgi:hypothetical protein
MDILLQQPGGGFREKALKDTADAEVTGLLLFDADNDGDLDLYTVSGSSEFHAHSENYQDRLFLNDGMGNFRYAPDALPEIRIDGSIVTACDYDRDGDLDLFVGGRMVPQSYPFPEKSILLQNDHGIFSDVTQSACKDLANLGMVTSALWTDYDNDGWVDLMVTGEWMPLRIFKNEKGVFSDVSADLGLAGTNGWWNSITPIDINNDGRTDYIVGNQGLNNRYEASAGKPVYVIAKDFDNNGIIDPVMNAWMNGAYYPLHFRNDLISQIGFMEKRFPTYGDYSIARSDSLFTPNELQGALELKAYKLSSSCFINSDSGKFTSIPLPFNAQFAPVKGILTGDFNHDDNQDVLLIGNDFTTEAFTGDEDALQGLFLKGEGNGNLTTVSISKSGFFVPGDGRSLVSLFNKNNDQLVIAARNNDSLRVFKVSNPGSNWTRFNPGPSDRLVKLYFRNGNVQAHELHYGSSWLSQTSREFLIDTSKVSKIVVTDYRNEPREIKYP